MAEFGEVASTATDDSETSSASSLDSPPPKICKKVKRQVKSRKSKVAKKPIKGRKRKRLTSPASSSGSSESLLSSESDESPKRRMTSKSIGRAKKNRKEYRKSKSALKAGLPKDSRRTNHLLEVFQKHYKSLVTMIKSCPIDISSALFSKGFIFEDTLNQVITGQDSQSKKAALLLCDVRAHLKVDPEMLVEFVKLLEQEKSFDFLTNQMKGKCIIISAKVIQSGAAPQVHYSLSPLHTLHIMS